MLYSKLDLRLWRDCMRLSKDFFYTLREDAKDEDSVSGNLLVKSGMRVANRKIKIQKILYNILPMILSTIIMGGGAYLLQQVSTSMLWNIISIFLCIVVYFSALFGLFPKIRHEFLGSYFEKKTN